MPPTWRKASAEPTLLPPNLSTETRRAEEGAAAEDENSAAAADDDAADDEEGEGRRGRMATQW